MVRYSRVVLERHISIAGAAHVSDLVASDTLAIEREGDTFTVYTKGLLAAGEMVDIPWSRVLFAVRAPLPKGKK